MLCGRQMMATQQIGPAVTLSASDGDNYVSTEPSPATNRPVAGWRANTNGAAEHAAWDTGGSANWLITLTAPDWLLRGSASAFELRATEVSQSGTATRTGTLGTWQALSSTRTYQIEKSTTSDGTVSWELDIEIREIANPANIVTGRITLTGIILP